MTYFFTLLAALWLLAAPSAAQTMKTLSYNTNGVVSYSSSNTMRFTNSVIFSNSVNFASELTIMGDELFRPDGYSIDLGGGNVTDQNFETVVALSTSNITLARFVVFSTTENATKTMRSLAGSTNTNEPYSGTVALTNTNVLTFSNGILVKIQ